MSLKKALITPVILISAGLVAITDNEILDRREVKEFRDTVTPHFHTSADDYLQYAPLITTLAMKAVGVKSTHNWTNMSLLIVKSELLMTAIVVPVKKITAVERPDGGSYAFPSGHTAQAFVAATILHREFGKDHPFISVLGYVTASSVGIIRVMNDRHWVSDVLAGAGIGILSTNLAYLTHRNRWVRNSRVLSNMTFSPSWSQKTAGLSMIWSLK